MPIQAVEAEGNTNIWYVHNKDHGFTTDPALARRDRTGAPLIAPGHMRRLAGRLAKRMNDHHELLWEATLDKMEELYTLQEEKGLCPEVDATQNTLLGMYISLAVMWHGPTYKLDPDNAVKMVEREAERRYEQSVEG